VGDVMAVAYYNRHADIKLVLRLLPWVLVGIGAALFTGHVITDEMFQLIIGIIVMTCLFLMVSLNKVLENKDLSKYWWLAAPVGLAGGFATMIGNAASPIIGVYFLLMKMPKNSFIGTAAWYFLIVNYIKLPLHYFFWKTISIETLVFDAVLVPCVIFGAVSGIYLVKRIPVKAFTVFILASTFTTAVVLIIQNL